jgi:hypothetical protein
MMGTDEKLHKIRIDVKPPMCKYEISLCVRVRRFIETYCTPQFAVLHLVLGFVYGLAQ